MSSVVIVLFVLFIFAVILTVNYQANSPIRPINIKKDSAMVDETCDVYRYVKGSLEMKTAIEENKAKTETLRLQILNWIPSEIARQPEKLKQFEASLAKDVEEHSITFTRYGDFVGVAQKRGNVKTLRAIPAGPLQYVPGRAPSLDNSGDAAELYLQSNYGSFNTASIWDGFGWVFIDGVAAPDIKIDTGLASPATDDRIVFKITKEVVAVPYGLGEAVFATLLQALGEGG